MERRLLTLFAETPVHAGGPESLAAVDLPIQREAATGLPVIWGQSLKGALRQAWRDAGLPDEQTAFGSRPPGFADDEVETGDAGAVLTKGALSVGDAQLVLFPAATLRQVFGWVTAPLLLSRLGRKLRLLGTDPDPVFQVTISGGYGLGAPGWEGAQVLGPFIENIRADSGVSKIGAILAQLVCPTDTAFEFTRRKMATDVLLVEDSTIQGLTRMGTDIVVRVQLEEKTKTVAHGPFYSEHLPAETVLAALLAGSDDHLKHLAGLLNGQPVQLGGDETIGKGVLWCRVHSASWSATAGEPSQRDLPVDETRPVQARPDPPPAQPVSLSPRRGNGPSPAMMRGRRRG